MDIEAGFQKNESEQVFSEAGNHLSIVKSSNLNQLADGFKIQIFEVDSMQAIKDINDLEKGNDNLKKETENTARNKKIMCISVTGALVIALLIFIPITVLVVLELQK